MKPRIQAQFADLSLPVLFIITAMVLSSAFTIAADTKSGTDKTLTGVVSDSMCGAQHMAKDKTAAACTKMCVKDGSKYALVVGNDVYTLQGHEGELDKLAGEKVTVKGKVSGMTVDVQSVQPGK
jgi:hypothetical protein